MMSHIYVAQTIFQTTPPKPSKGDTVTKSMFQTILTQIPSTAPSTALCVTMTLATPVQLRQGYPLAPVESLLDTYGFTTPDQQMSRVTHRSGQTWR